MFLILFVVRYFLRTREGVQIVSSFGIADSVAGAMKLEFVSGLMRWFEENPFLISRDSIPTTVSAAKEMHLLGAQLGVPMLCSGRIIGAILIGDKVSGRSYSNEERELLTTLSRSAAIAFENAHSYVEVSQKQDHLNTILSNISSGVVLVNQSRVVTMMNDRAAQILRIPSSEVIGRSVQKLGSEISNVVLHVLRDSKPLLRQEIKDHLSKMTLGLSATPIGDEGVAIIFGPIPREEEIQEDLEYSPYWEYLAARVAQEVKNPLVAINTFAQLLPHKYQSDDFREQFGEVVQGEVNRINGVVETLFEFARHPHLVFQPGYLSETVDTVLASFEDAFEDATIEMRSSLDTDLEPIEFDPVYISQALHNVIKNAIDAMPTGGTLSIELKASGDYHEILVRDTGSGIPEDSMSLIFLPYYGTRETGMGLGLTVASRTMHQHQGELELLESDEGCVFALRLPIKRVPVKQSPSDGPAIAIRAQSFKSGVTQ